MSEVPTTPQNPAPEVRPEPSEVRSEVHAELRPELRPEVRNWCEVWKTCLEKVISQISGQPTVLQASSAPLLVADSDLWYMVVAGGAVRGEMTLRLSAASGGPLARKFLGEPEPAEEATAAGPMAAEPKEALEELLRQVAGLAATALAATAGGEVQLHLSASAAPSWSSDAIVCLGTGNEAVPAITVEIQISSALSAALQARVQATAAAQASPTLSASAATA